MVKVRLQLKSGTKIIIEGDEKEAAQIVTRIEGIAQTNGKGAKRGAKQTALAKKRHTATVAILELRDSGFFDKPKTALEIRNRLEEEGWIYSITSMPSFLLPLVRKRLLGRIKIDKVFGYVKR